MTHGQYISQKIEDFQHDGQVLLPFTFMEYRSEEQLGDPVFLANVISIFIFAYTSYNINSHEAAFIAADLGVVIQPVLKPMNSELWASLWIRSLGMTETQLKGFPFQLTISSIFTYCVDIVYNSNPTKYLDPKPLVKISGESKVSFNARKKAHDNDIFCNYSSYPLVLHQVYRDKLTIPILEYYREHLTVVPLLRGINNISTLFLDDERTKGINHGDTSKWQNILNESLNSPIYKFVDNFEIGAEIKESENSEEKNKKKKGANDMISPRDQLPSTVDEILEEINGMRLSNDDLFDVVADVQSFIEEHRQVFSPIWLSTRMTLSDWVLALAHTKNYGIMKEKQSLSVPMDLEAVALYHFQSLIVQSPATIPVKSSDDQLKDINAKLIEIQTKMQDMVDNRLTNKIANDLIKHLDGTLITLGELSASIMSRGTKLYSPSVQITTPAFDSDELNAVSTSQDDDETMKQLLSMLK